MKTFVANILMKLHGNSLARKLYFLFPYLRIYLHYFIFPHTSNFYLKTWQLLINCSLFVLFCISVLCYYCVVCIQIYTRSTEVLLSCIVVEGIHSIHRINLRSILINEINATL